ncbi:RpiB/LacA/LacB family sugar-phosphate isomerase [bacterium]|nr:RpiB/LacA/LacB family sugar-phosphate isomerase [bacterium]
MPFRLAVASDHAGFPLKKLIVAELEKAGHTVEDFGCNSEAAADVSDHVGPAAEALGAGRFDRAIFIDGAGYPSGMVANMFHGVFAAVCNDTVSAKLAREHGGANALCIGAMIIGAATAREIVRLFLDTQALPGKYADRRAKVAAIGAKQRLGPLHRPRQVVTVEDLRQAIMAREPLVMDEKTVVTPSVVDAVRSMRA